ncbi:MAG TPA: efflux RND transporter periplasmic adaptor subunit [Verrucomicrobiae bacterium]|nr:efflux RND transporter periplasmic adaptor subunit [Verrucomicrobiae bacterium]
MKTAVRLGVVVGVLGLAVGCGRSEGSGFDPAPSAGDATSAPAKADGFVHLSQESARYLGTEPVASESESLPLHLPARLEFKDGAVSEIGAPLAGRVNEVLVHSGDRVRAGAPLFLLSCPDAASARTGLATAEAALKEASATAERQARMLEEGVGNARDKLAADMHLEAARAEAERARATTKFIGEGEGADTTVRAPMTGVVLAVKATTGATVEPGGEALVTVGDPSSVWVVVDVPEHDLPSIVEGGRATVELATMPSPVPAKVISVGAVVERGLRTAPVRMTLEEDPPGLRPGMFGWARLDTTESSPTLPVEAVLIKDGKESIVYVARDDVTFERRPVVVGRPVEGRVPVVSGLQAGERVVVRGALLLDGSAEQLL